MFLKGCTTGKACDSLICVPMKASARLVRSTILYYQGSNTEAKNNSTCHGNMPQRYCWPVLRFNQCLLTLHFPLIVSLLLKIHIQEPYRSWARALSSPIVVTWGAPTEGKRWKWWKRHTTVLLPLCVQLQGPIYWSWWHHRAPNRHGIEEAVETGLAARRSLKGRGGDQVSALSHSRQSLRPSDEHSTFG